MKAEAYFFGRKLWMKGYNYSDTGIIANAYALTHGSTQAKCNSLANAVITGWEEQAKEVEEKQ